MKLNSRRLILFGLMLWSTLTVRSISFVSAQASYSFAYLHVTQFGESGEIFFIDPANRDSSARKQPYPLPEGWRFNPLRFPSIASPGGDWIASTLFAADNSRLMIHLLHVSSGETHQIIEGFIFRDGQSVAWSPDGRYLALNIRQVAEEDVNLFIYSVPDDRLINLTNDEFHQRDLGWWYDSSHVLTITKPCAMNDACGEQLEVWNIAEATRIAAIDLSSLPFLGSSACNPNVSPDGRVISFASNCGLGIPISFDFPNEVYLWNLEQGDLNQITSLESEANQARFIATYNHIWLDNETLLIGFNYQIGSGAKQYRLESYNVPDNVNNVLSTTIGTEFALNPVRGQVALRNEATESERIELRFADLDDLLSNSNGFNLDSITASVDLPSGCYLDWSPDGSVLAFSVYTERDCQWRLNAVVFINPLTQSTVEHPLVLDNLESDGYVTPIGWIAG